MIEVQENNITCPFLKEALDRAGDQAFVDMSRVDVAPHIYSDRYGHHLVGKRTGRGKSACEFCGKKVEVIYTAEKAEGLKNFEGEPVRAFDFIGSQMKVKVGGEKCQE